VNVDNLLTLGNRYGMVIPDYPTHSYTAEEDFGDFHLQTVASKQ
jgi:hypothetical protein